MSDLSPEAKNTFDILLNEAAPAAEHFLQKNKEFYPFALTLDNDRTVSLVAADTEKEDHPESKEIISFLVEKLKQRESQAACLVTMVSLPDSTDAVAIDFDHRDGGKMRFILPYSLKGAFKKIVLGRPEFQKGSQNLL